MDKIEFELTKPISTPDDENCRRLVFREPSAADIDDNGSPFEFGMDGNSFRLMTKALTRHMAQLAGVPIASIRKMSAGDYHRAAFALTPFFLGGLEEEMGGDEGTTG